MKKEEKEIKISNKEANTLKRYPNYIIHFDNGDSLEHFGIPGMKWGINKVRSGASTVGRGVKKVGRKVASGASTVGRTVAKPFLAAQKSILKGYDKAAENKYVQLGMKGLGKVSRGLAYVHSPVYTVAQRQLTKQAKGQKQSRGKSWAKSYVKRHAIEHPILDWSYERQRNVAKNTRKKS
jgi:hypothetical protein